MKFEQEFAEWIGVKYALGFNNGTASLLAAMYACGVRKGDEIICPSVTYWASCLQAMTLGATVVFANVKDDTLCIDPDDIEAKITPRTKAIVCVHYLAHPCDMDPIMAIAKKHNLYVIEDVSHAQGAMYKGKRVGTFGDIAAMSLMSGKAFAAGELGILVTDNTKLYERAMAFGHYERNNGNYIKESEDLIVIEVEGNGFLYNMVRIMAGTLIYVAEGKLSPDDITRITKSLDRKQTGFTAPACGLFLNKVIY